MNKVILFGNLTRDPEVKAGASGFTIASFGMATNRRVKKGDVWQDVPEFHNIVVFGRQAETSGMYLKKGNQVLVEGRIQTRTFEKDGEKQYRTEIVADTVQFGRSSEKKIDTEKVDDVEVEPDVEDVPF